MDKKRAVIIFTVAAAGLLLVLAWALVDTRAGTEKAQEQETVQDGHEMASPEEAVRQFAEVVYTYDTRERQFYEGVEDYMTAEAYAALVPLQDPDEAGEDAPIQMISELEGITCYYNMSENAGLEGIAEIEYSLSGMGDYSNMQLLKFALVYADGWKISECTVLATIER